MRSSTWRLDDLKNVTLNLGFVGENLHTRQIIDCKKMFDQYPQASVSMTVTPPEGEPYPGQIERDGDLVIWDVRDCDLAAEGDGEIQIVFTQEPHIARSINVRTHICRSQQSTGSVPSGYEDFITRADKLLDQVEETFPAGGTTGQVLAKKSDEDYDTEWVDQSGGGGGTSDYEELENLPQIGGVTLKGNKSLSDLGAATESAVNEKYTKPSGGIPASDMADGVIPVLTDLIDDTAGDGDTDKVWSADKSAEELQSVLSQITNQSSINSALLTVLQHVAFTDEAGATAYNALYALVHGTPTHELVSISATFDPSAIVYAWDDIDILKDNLTVMATYSDSQTPVEVTTGYTLSGSLALGNCTITVTYEGKTATFTVLVYDFVFANGYVNSTNNSTQKKVQIKTNTARILCDSTVGIVPLKDANGDDTIYYAIPIRQDMTGLVMVYPQGYRRSMVAFEWSESLNDFVQVAGSGWNDLHTKLMFTEDLWDGNHYVGVTFSGANGTEDMSEVDTSEWSVIMQGRETE